MSVSHATAGGFVGTNIDFTLLDDAFSGTTDAFAIRALNVTGTLGGITAIVGSRMVFDLRGPNTIYPASTNNSFSTLAFQSGLGLDTLSVLNSFTSSRTIQEPFISNPRANTGMANIGSFTAGSITTAPAPLTAALLLGGLAAIAFTRKQKCA